MNTETTFWVAIILIISGFSIDGYYRMKAFLKKFYDEGEERDD
jgi:hypothetical protein